MINTGPSLARTISEAWAEAAKGIEQCLDQLRRTVSLVLPKPDEEAGGLAVWRGDGWEVRLVGDEVHVTGGCAPGETTAVAAAMIAADRIRNTRTEAAADREAEAAR